MCCSSSVLRLRNMCHNISEDMEFHLNNKKTIGPSQPCKHIHTLRLTHVALLNKALVNVTLLLATSSSDYGHMHRKSFTRNSTATTQQKIQNLTTSKPLLASSICSVEVFWLNQERKNKHQQGTSGSSTHILAATMKSSECTEATIGKKDFLSDVNIYKLKK